MSHDSMASEISLPFTSLNPYPNVRLNSLSGSFSYFYLFLSPVDAETEETLRSNSPLEINLKK